MQFIENILGSCITFFYGITTMLGFPNYGVAIILLTIAIKLILYPLTVKQVKSMKAMQILQPKLKEIQEKFKNDKEKLQKEMQNLYKNNGVNPLAGCLPMIIQMPILIALFYTIKGYDYTSNPSFLWIMNLAQDNPSDPFYILPILSALTTYVQTKQTTVSSAGSGDNPQAKIMLYFMPLFIGYITITFPAGLGLYWVTSNASQIAQQWWIARNDADEVVVEKPVALQGGSKKNVKSKNA